MRKIILISLVATIFGCSDRELALQKLDTPPEILVSKINPSKGMESITDSVRFYDTPGFFYNVRILVKDEKKNIWKLNYKANKGDVKVLYDGADLNLSSIRADLSEVLLSVSPKSKGLVSVDFKVEDRFNNSKTATLNLFVFDNLIPVAVLNAKKMGVNSPLEYSIDGLKSYDQDSNFNGKVVGYIYQIEGKTIQTTNPTINYIFPVQGTYNIELKVIDNNGAESLPTMLKLNVI